jgi:hypothetical protein
MYAIFVNNLAKTTDFLEFDNRPVELANYLATSFPVYLQTKLNDSADEVFRMMTQFVIITRCYRCFRESVRQGDSITIESLYNVFTPIWIATGKHHYFEICLTQMEELYCAMPYPILQLVRENLTVPLHKGRNKRGQRMAHWALDQIIELIQHKFKLMDFPNTVEGWQHHSVNMPLVSRCVTHCDLEYSGRFDVDSFDAQFERGIPDGDETDKGNKRQSTVPSKRLAEKTMIAEILCLTNALVETPGRKMTDDIFWSVFPKVTTVLSPDNDEDLKSRTQMAMSAEEILLSEMTNGMLDGEQVETRMDQETLAMEELEPLTWATMMVAEDESMPTVDGINRNEEDVEVAGVKIRKVTKMKLNRLALENVQLRGEKKMQEMEIGKVRFWRKCRRKREIRALQSDLNAFLNRNDGEDVPFDAHAEVPASPNEHGIKFLNEFRDLCSTNESSRTS